MSEKPIVIIQTGHMRTGTTLLVNLLYGFISPEEKIRCLWEISHDIRPFHDNCNIYKSHCLNIEGFMQQHKEKYNVFFVCTERDDKKINEKYKKMQNVLVFDYKEILETDSYSTHQIIENIYSKLREHLPETVLLDKETCKTRIQKMNETYKEIENKDFSHVNEFFQLHGKHRNRDA
jgi:hypothetical protein|tara:strand:- start:916 stop:1446 length:531 start_codon:yes stop_codon:yes gene_type:complete